MNSLIVGSVTPSVTQDRAIQGSWSKGWNLSKRFRGVRLQQHFVENHSITGQKRSVLLPTYGTKHLVVACNRQTLGTGPESYRPDGYLSSTGNWVDAFYRFSRPHTVIGTALSIISVSLLAVQKLSPVFFTGMLEAIIAALFMNIYIVGLNQLSDVEIDKVNKPYLPLASGEYSVGSGTFIVTSFAMLTGDYKMEAVGRSSKRRIH